MPTPAHNQQPSHPVTPAPTCQHMPYLRTPSHPPTPVSTCQDIPTPAHTCPPGAPGELGALGAPGALEATGPPEAPATLARHRCPCPHLPTHVHPRSPSHPWHTCPHLPAHDNTCQQLCTPPHTDVPPELPTPPPLMPTPPHTASTCQHMPTPAHTCPHLPALAQPRSPYHPLCTCLLLPTHAGT